jgi:hypothetical protein
VLNKQFAAWEDIARGLVEYKAQRAYIYTATRTTAGIDKLYIAILIQTELESLRGVVYLGRHYGVGHIKIGSKLLIYIYQGCALWKAFCDVVVLTANL